MKKQNRIISLFLAMIMIVTNFFVLSSIEVSAATAASIEGLGLSSDTVSIGDSVQVEGRVKSGSYYLRAIALEVRNLGNDSHGKDIDRIDWDFDQKKTSYSLSNLNELIIGSYTCEACKTTETLGVGRHRIDVHVGLYDSKGNVATGFTKNLYVTVTEDEEITVQDIDADISGTEVEFTVKTNLAAKHGIILVVDDTYELDMIDWEMDIYSKYIKYTGTHNFNIAGNREITVYALDKYGDIIYGSEDYITINITSNGKIESPKVSTLTNQTITANEDFSVAWNEVTVPNGNEVTYNVFVMDEDKNNVRVNSSPITGTSYTIDGSYFSNEGEYVVSVIAIADGYEQSDDDLSAISLYVIENEDPVILGIEPSKKTVSVGETFTITVTTNSDAQGVIVYVDSIDNNWIAGECYEKSKNDTYTFTYSFNKTGKEDSYGNDISSKRTLIACPIDSKGNILTEYNAIYDVSVTVNPANYSFNDFAAHDTIVDFGKSVTIKWDSVSSKNGAQVYYKLWIDNILIAENLTSNSYTISADKLQSFGAGSFGIMVIATADQHRQKQGSIGTLTIRGDGIITPGDANGDGKINASDAVKLRNYLANNDSTSIPTNGSINAGADLNKDGKINGKDLTRLLVILAQNGEIIPQEPEPEIPSIPEKNHTYTVSLPLDTANLKSTTDKTIYVMPVNGYFALRAYDETGKAYRLDKVGISIEFSNPSIFSFGGDTLVAKKCGYCVVIFKQVIDGKTKETRYDIHVGTTQASTFIWPSSYQYTSDDYDYVSLCLDMMYSLDKANTPNYEELEMGLGDLILEGMGDWKDRLQNLIQGDINFETKIIKESLALFIDNYAKEFENANKEIEENAKKDALDVVEMLKLIDDLSDELDQNIGGVKDLIDSITYIRSNNVTIEKIAELQSQIDWMYKNGQLREMFNSSPRLKAYLATKEISLRQFTEKLAKTKTLTGRFKIDEVGFGLDFLKCVVYVSSNYSYNIKLLSMLKEQIIQVVETDSPEMEAITELIDEYDNKFYTSMTNFIAMCMINGIESTIMKHPIFAIFELASTIANNINHTEEKTNLRNLIFYHTALGGLIDKYSGKMYVEGVKASSLEDMHFVIHMYLNLLLYENQIALNVVNKDNASKVQEEIQEIKTVFSDYLIYQLPNETVY